MYQHLHWIVRMCVVRVSCQEEKRQQKREIKSTRVPVSENGTVGIEFSQWGRSMRRSLVIKTQLTSKSGQSLRPTQSLRHGATYTPFKPSLRPNGVNETGEPTKEE